MFDLNVHGRMEGDYAIEMADSLNTELGSDSDYILAYVVHEGVYLCEKADEEPTWRYECEFKQTDGDIRESTDKVAGKVEDDNKFVDFPGTDYNRSLFLEVTN